MPPANFSVIMTDNEHGNVRRQGCSSFQACFLPHLVVPIGPTHVMLEIPK